MHSEYTIDSVSTHARSHRYPDDDTDTCTITNTNQYTDTTYYDEDDEYFDLGYQRLRQITPSLYPEFRYLTKLFIDHNNLSSLPDQVYLPLLEELTCSYNNLSTLPYYPNLTFLNMSNNNITRLDQYDKSKIVYLDCSYNNNFVLNFNLPNCEQLYINNTNLDHIDLAQLPLLKILDAENNKLNTIDNNNNLIELNINCNNVSTLPPYAKLIRLMADYNRIERLDTYASLESITISFNKLSVIHHQPNLKSIIADNNNICTIGAMPKLEFIDLAHNILSDFIIPSTATHIYLQFNPLTKLILTPALSTIKELQVNFETYKYIYANYYQDITGVKIQTNEEKLEMMLKRLNRIFDDSMTRYVFRKFSAINFQDRERILRKITYKLYWNYLPINGFKSLQELEEGDVFQYLLRNMSKFYYKTIFATVYFNGYFN